MRDKNTDHPAPGSQGHLQVWLSLLPLGFCHLLVAQGPMSVPPAHQPLPQQHHSWAAHPFLRAEPHPGLPLAHPHPQGGAWCHPGAWHRAPGRVMAQTPAAQLCPGSPMGAPAPLTLMGPRYSAGQTGNAHNLVGFLWGMWLYIKKISSIYVFMHLFFNSCNLKFFKRCYHVVNIS